MSTKQSKKTSHPSRGIMRLLNKLNLTLPTELQLPPLTDIASVNVLKERFKVIEDRLAKIEPQGRMPQMSHSVPSIDEKAIASLATNAWRAKVRMLDADTGEVKDDMKRVYRHIEAIVESLKQLGVETIDQTERNYDSGMALKVVSFEPTPGVSKETIKETIKPSVIWQGRLIQIGEIIVGTPVTNSDADKGIQNEQNNH